MKYIELPTAYKQERMHDILHALDSGKAVSINGLFLEEIKFLKAMYGQELKKDRGIIYRVMEMEALFK